MGKNSINNKSRRQFLLGSVAIGGAAMFPPAGAGRNLINEAWSRENTSASFHSLCYKIIDYGGVGDGETMNTDAIQALIDRVSSNGGGSIYFPPGVFLTGTFRIKDNTNIHLAPGATILGSPDRKDYTNQCLVYAQDAENISITGQGTINGNGESFWRKFYRKNLTEEEMRKNMWRPGRLSQFVRCRDLLLEGITMENSPAWTIHPVDCERVRISGISILNGVYEEDGPNTDGINPDGCSNVIISDCYLRCGDDCIVVKITDRPGGNKVCRDIVVTNCVLQTTETALKVGTETHGSFSNITFSNCVVYDSGCCFGLWMRDGGIIDGVSVTNVTMNCDKLKNGQGIFIWSHRRNDDTPFGTIKNVSISNMILKAGGGIFIQGNEEKYVQGIVLDNIRIQAGEGRQTKLHDNPEYPFKVFAHRQAPYDIYCRFVDGLKLRNVELTWGAPEKKEWGSAIRCREINGLEINGFTGRQSLGADSPAIWLKNVNGAYIHNCQAPEGTDTFLYCGPGTKDITLMGNNLQKARNLFKTGHEVGQQVVFESFNRLPD